MNETILTNLNDLILSLSDSLKYKDAYLTKQNCQNIKKELKGLDPLWLEFVESLGITGKYYIMFIEIAQIMKRYVNAERIGDWDGRLVETENMMPYIISAKHRNYTPWLPLYLKDMRALSQSHPDVHAQFKAGNFTVRLKPGKANGV